MLPRLLPRSPGRRCGCHGSKMTLAVVVLLALLPLSCAQPYGVMVLGEYYKEYTFTCNSGLFIGLTANKTRMDAFSPTEGIPLVRQKLPYPGEIVGISPDENFGAIVVVHNSYITRLAGYPLRTWPVPVEQATSLVLLGKSACLVGNSAPSVTMNITCVDLLTGSYKVCAASVTGPVWAGTNVPKNWVYRIDSASDVMSKYGLVNGCLEFIRSRDLSSYGLHGKVRKMWFSFDGSRIFLENGLTLDATDEPPTDMQSHGYINSQEQNWYNWFYEPHENARHIAGLRKDKPGSVFYFSWPSLQQVNQSTIPVMKNGELLDSQQVYYCDGYSGQTLVAAQYQVPHSGKETGVAYINP